MLTLLNSISKILEDAFLSCGYDSSYGKVTISNRPDLCQFQCNGALPAAKQYKKPPFKIATEVLEALKDNDAFEEVTIAGPGSININLKDSFISSYINNMYNDKKYGCSEAENPKTIVIDYGGANIAKPLHVGHLRSAIIGESIKRTARFLGHKVISDVHLGDWGLQIGMVISELKRRQPNLPYFDDNFTGEYPKEAPFTIDELEDIYPKASALAKQDEKAMEEAKEATFQLQQKKPGYIALWKHIYNVSVTDLKKNYGNLNVEFDLWKGESDCEDYIPKLIDFLNNTGLPYKSQGALIMDVAKEDDSYEVPPIIILKSDGASLYSTTDLATIMQRVEDYNPDEIIYITDKRQSLHFEQIFRCARKTGLINDSVGLQHIGFGTMNGKDGKPFKTREGGVMRLQHLIAIIKDAVRAKIESSNDIADENTKLSDVEVEEISRKVGLSALKYGDLSNQPTKDYIFDLDRFASFEGNTGPYILYTVVRMKSILSKATDCMQSTGTILSPVNESERELMLKVAKFNEVVSVALNDMAPNKICEYIYDLSNAFNRFYHDNRILTQENIDQKKSWLNLIMLTKNVLVTALDLLGIETPERM